MPEEVESSSAVPAEFLGEEKESEVESSVERTLEEAQKDATDEDDRSYEEKPRLSPVTPNPERLAAKRDEVKTFDGPGIQKEG